ncbi:MAG: hypothetical protein R3346_01525 [Candidatus Spechtbacterales bacterium]|nr:hypothetical protein [Candidatus Spechtbacterales bacterium]
MRYVVETEFVFTEVINDIEYDQRISCPVKVSENTHPPYRTMLDAENALKERVTFWRNRGYSGGVEITHSEKNGLRRAQSCLRRTKKPEQVCLKIEEREVSRTSLLH